MLTFRIIREDQSNVADINEFSFYSGEDRTLKLQLLTAYDSQPYLLSGTATVQIIVPNNTITPTTKSATIDSINKSVISAAFSDTDTPIMISGYIKVVVTDGSDVRIAMRDNVMRKIA